MPFCFRVFPEILTPSEKLGQNKLSGSLNQTKIKYHIKDNTINSLSQYYISIYGISFIKPLQFFHEITIFRFIELILFINFFVFFL